MKVILVLVLFFSFNAFGNFESFDELLKNNTQTVSTSAGDSAIAFDYIKMKADPKSTALIEKQKAFLKDFKIDNLKTKNEALAFWINSYNFFMIATIYENGFSGSQLKINSVKDLGSFISPYKVFKQKNMIIGQQKYSLDNIEKGILLGKVYKEKKWKDARIHFAVNCASVGCPPLMTRSYSAATLDQDLDNNVKNSLQSRRHFYISGKTLYLTHLFKWYQKDFVEDSKSIPLFIKKYITNKDTITGIDQATETQFIPYDWRLNLPNNFK